MSKANLTRTCAVCQKPLSRPTAKFCSRACQGMSKRVPKEDKCVERTCPICEQPFLAILSEVARGRGTFCSKACYQKRRKPIAERFWKKVNKDGPVPAHCPELGECWVWTKALHPFGYGMIQDRENSDRVNGIDTAHRVSWRMHFGPIPEGMCVMHRCDNPACVRPEHLTLGTLKDNTQDMLQKRRHMVILSPEQTAELRARYAGGGVSQAQLAREYGVSTPTVSNIIRHRNNY